MKAHEIVSDLLNILEWINLALRTNTICALISLERWGDTGCGHAARDNLLSPTLNRLGRCYIHSGWLQIK